MILPLDKYNQAFFDLLNDPNFMSRVNEMKIFAKPTRTGKNHDEINVRIPHIFKNYEVLLNTQTSPLTGIIVQNERMIKDICRDNKWEYENDPEEILTNFLREIPTVTYWTNSYAFTQKTTAQLYQEIVNLGKMHMVSTTADEMDTWSMSNWRDAGKLKGKKMYSEEDFAASMYTTIELIAQYSPFVFGLTATANFQVSGLINTIRNLIYTLINPLVAGEQDIYAPHVGLFGSATFYDLPGSLFSAANGMSREDVFRKMLKKSYAIERATRLKRATLLQCGNDYDEPKNSENLNPSEVLALIQRNRDLIPHGDHEEIIAIMESDRIETYDITGRPVQKSLREKDIYNYLNDLKHPLRYLLVKLMAGRGVTLETIKNVMSFRISNKSSDLGLITEQTEQFITRAKSVYVGTAKDDFVTKYDRDVLNVPGFSLEANCYDIYLPDTNMMREAVRKHKEFDACTPEMLGLEYKDYSEICDKCGRPWPVHDNSEHEEEVEMPNVDKKLGIA